MKTKIILIISCIGIFNFLQAFGGINLLISGGIVPNSMTRGGTYTVTFYVKNTGSTSTTTPFLVNVSLNTTATYDGKQAYLNEITVNGGIGANSTKTITGTITIPCSSTAGVKYVLAGADATNLIPETDETDNNLPGLSVLIKNLATPVTSNATSISQTGFHANWQAIPEANSYSMDVATNNTFTTILPGYNKLNVGNVTSKAIVGLNCNSVYYYRVTAINNCGSSSEVTSGEMVTTSPCSPPLCNNDNICSSMALSINTSGSCVNTGCSTVNATPPVSDIPFNGSTGCSSPYQSARYDDDVWFSITPTNSNLITINLTPTSNLGNFDITGGIYSGNCTSPVQIACATANGVGAAEQLTFTPTANVTYFIRVFSYGIGSIYAGNFNICAFSSCVPPEAPTGLTVQSSSCNTVSLSWDKVSGSGITYEVLKNNTSCGSVFGSSGLGPISGTSGTVNATPGTNYYFVVYAIGCVSSTNSNCVNTTTPTTPSQPGNISGEVTVCQGSSHTYSINAVQGATNYTWTLPLGWLGNSTTTSITTTANSGGTISVTANNDCGSSAAQTLVISIDQSPGDAVVSGPTSPIENSTQNYTASASNATSYTWTFPAGWIMNSSQGSPTLNVTVKANSGQVCATPSNNCGNGASSCLKVNVSPSGTQEMNAFTDIQVYPNPTNGDFKIDYSLNQKTQISIKLYDAMGNLIKIITERKQMSGDNSCIIDASKLNGGTYLLEVQLDERIINKKLVIIR